MSTDETTHTVTVEPVPAPKQAPANDTSAWNTLARDGQPHPVWWHPWLTTAWVGASGLLVDASSADWSWGYHLGITAAAASLGTVVGAAASDTAAEHQRSLGMESAALGTVTGAAAGLWTWIASGLDLASHPLQPAAWAGLALGGAAWGAWYAALRLRLARSRRPGSAAHIKLTTKAFRSEYAQIMADAGFGRVEVAEVKAGFGGHTERATIHLDPTRNDTSQSVANAAAKLQGIAARVFAEKRGVDLPDEALSVVKVRGKARQVHLDIKLDEITAVITPDLGEDFTQPVTDPAHPLLLGLMLNSGEPMLQPEAGPHGVAVGASGSGKSTYFRAQVVNYLPRPHVALMAAGTSKFLNFLAPFLRPIAEGKVQRGPFCMLGGGDGGTEAEAMSAVKTVMAAYILYRHRMTSPDTPRDDGGNIIPSKDHPRTIVYLDEINDLVKRCRKDNVSHKTFALPNGEKLSLPQMLEHLGSKGRSEGVELEVGSQRLTDEFLGFAGRNLINNMQRRAVFYTRSRSDASAVTDRLDASKIQPHTLYLALSAKAALEPAKVIHYTSEHVATAMMAAEANDTFGDITGAEAEALGELWTGRWDADRVGTIAATAGVPQLVAGGAAPTATPAATSGTAGGGAGRRSARIDAAIARAKAEAAGNSGDDDQELDADQQAMFDGVMADLAGLPTIDDSDPASAAATVPGMVSRDAEPATILAAVLRLIGDRSAVAPIDLLVGLGWLDSDQKETDPAEYNSAVGHLRDVLRIATGNPELDRKLVRLTGGGRDRWWRRADLEGGNGQ